MNWWMIIAIVEYILGFFLSGGVIAEWDGYDFQKNAFASVMVCLLWPPVMILGIGVYLARKVR